MTELDAETDDLEEGGEIPKSSKLKWIIILVLVLLIGAVGVYFLMGFLGDDADELAEGGGTMEELAEETGPIDDEDLVYLTIERLPAPLMDSGGRVQGYVFMDFSLEMDAGPNQSFVAERMPRVKDAFIRAISANGVGRADAPGIIDFDRVAEYLKEAANEVLGGKLVKRVMIVRDLRTPA